MVQCPNTNPKVRILDDLKVVEILITKPCHSERCIVDGNPSNLARFLDESLNGTLAKVCRSAHSLVWHYRVMVNFEQTEMRRVQKRR